MSSAIYINEIYPNPESGSEWIEFLANSEDDDNLNLSNYTIFDNYHQIYKFSNEKFTDQILVVEVSGLNNDQDSVVFKDPSGNILDSFSYSETQKGVSWVREPSTNNFILNAASKNLINPIITPEITPSPTTSTTFTSTLTPTTSITPIKSNENNPSPSINSVTKQIKKPYNYDLSRVQFKTEEKTFTDRKTRLVILGETRGKVEILNAIIGSSLIILSSLFLIYVKIKRKHS